MPDNENKGLIFIPDISGFTNFVNKTEMEHSRLIIQELLEIIISSNTIGLEVSEIEGDAILFYKFGTPPELNAIYEQVEKMFCDFHRHIIAYDISKYCQCKACTSAADLTIKVITHYGEFTKFNVSNFNKLFGKDVIIAHQLLKNDIDQHEYWLVTPQLTGMNDTPPGIKNRMQWNTSSLKTEQGSISFHYTILSDLKEKIKSIELKRPDLSNMTKLFSVSNEYETDIITLFHASGDFSYRNKWLEGVKKVEEISHFLPRIGTKCSCEKEDGKTNIYSSSYSYDPDKISFSETDENNKDLVFYTLDKITNEKTKLTIEYYIKKSITNRFQSRLKSEKIQKTYKKSLVNLTELVKELDFNPAHEEHI